MSVIALHGFWGVPEDWDLFKNSLGLQWRAYKIEAFPSFDEWSSRFIDKVVKETVPPRVLLGYSMGGRLALHALCRAPDLWKLAVFVSTHPGLTSEKERADRLESDLLWAEVFRKEPFGKLKKSWDSQPLFSQGGYSFLRDEKAFFREELASHLMHYSLGKQQNFREVLKKLEKPTAWIAGDRDSRYLNLAKEMERSSPLCRAFSVPNASHRTPWDQPEAFLNVLSQILDLLNINN